ncbi:D(1A) dopamine receptor-like [Montipora capricornis]|uniref:D(1A) dopamine receptor-like n=1 Tax=Montipora capricornis TaxID=246305 RepID=UPI0035F17A63
MSAETVITTTYMVLVSVIGTTGNLLVICAILRNRRLRTMVSNYFLFNLSVSDLLTVCLAIPLRLVEGFQPGSIPCSVVIAATVLFDGLSRLNISFVSVDRFVAVRFPFGYTLYMTSVIAVGLIISGWIVMTAFAVLPIVGVGSASPELLHQNHGLCFFSINLSTAYLLIFLIGFCLLPVVLSSVINLFLFKASHRQLRIIQVQYLNAETSAAVETNNFASIATNVEVRTEGNEPANTSRQQNCRRTIQLRQRKVLKMVTVLVSLFFVLVLPITLIDLLGAFGHSHVPPFVAKIAVCMIYTNAAINVFVYAGFNREFRKTFVQIIRAARAWITSVHHQ